MEMPYYTNLNERTANGDKRLIDLLYQKIELQQAEIKALRELDYTDYLNDIYFLKLEIEDLKKELALQRLSDFTQESGLEK